MQRQDPRAYQCIHYVMDVPFDEDPTLLRSQLYHCLSVTKTGAFIQNNHSVLCREQFYYFTFPKMIQSNHYHPDNSFWHPLTMEIDYH